MEPAERSEQSNLMRQLVGQRVQLVAGPLAGRVARVIESRTETGAVVLTLRVDIDTEPRAEETES